jgi:ApbE superfamily uncharacterized protein (UPF0280 family)
VETPIVILSAFEKAAVGRSYDPRRADAVAFVARRDSNERTVADVIAVCNRVVGVLSDPGSAHHRLFTE